MPLPCPVPQCPGQLPNPTLTLFPGTKRAIDTQVGNHIHAVISGDVVCDVNNHAFTYDGMIQATRTG